MEARAKPVPSVAILMSCYNRRDMTLGCLQAVFSQQTSVPRRVSIFLVDDGSSDGTSAAVRERFGAVRVIAGKGNLFWNGGMRVAFAEALREDFDAYVWLNDDTILNDNAFDVMLQAWLGLRASGVTAIVTASTCDAFNGERSYGGVRQIRGIVRRDLEPVEPSNSDLVPCDSMNGNFTLIPREVAQVVGNLDRGFTHSFGDLDYGFRARKAGFTVYIAPGFLGSCSDNSKAGTWRDSNATFAKRWRHLNSVKGSPWREWSLYCRRHQGPFWLLYAISPYLKVMTSRWLHRD